MNTLLERLVSWAQNEEMINQYFTDHGKDCNEAVKEIERLTAERDTAEAILEQLQNKFEAVSEESCGHPKCAEIDCICGKPISEQEGDDE
jgi:hypothetical protein